MSTKDLGSFIPLFLSFIILLFILCDSPRMPRVKKCTCFDCSQDPQGYKIVGKTTYYNHEKNDQILGRTPRVPRSPPRVGEFKESKEILHDQDDPGLDAGEAAPPPQQSQGERKEEKNLDILAALSRRSAAAAKIYGHMREGRDEPVEPGTVSNADIQYGAVVSFLKALSMLSIESPERTKKSFMDVSKHKISTVKDACMSVCIYSS
jgi:hypothetical protein